MIISVASGKGGTGKTTVATSMALSVKKITPLTFLDCDVEEPNAHIFLNPVISETERVKTVIPEVDEKKCTHCGKCSELCAFNALAVLDTITLVFGELCHACGSCWYFCPENAITQKEKEIGIIEMGRVRDINFIHGKLNIGEAMSPPLIKAVKDKISPQETVIIDAPPGTSCPVISSVKDTDFCVLVTEPTAFGLNDLMLSVGMLREMNIPCGVIINRAGIGDDRVINYCKAEHIPVLMEIPLHKKIASLYARGIPVVDGMPEYIEQFQSVYHTIERVIRS
ncbi:ATP-binding protein [Desulfolucanica intricata]|uniref:ATP-binding protein n=1 Tax=Desulfolucanica intricata TaxID=1285191 RepID=UPI00082C56FC|nr:ATP-binding protein [Desulfolucanica intricata]